MIEIVRGTPKNDYLFTRATGHMDRHHDIHREKDTPREMQTYVVNRKVAQMSEHHKQSRNQIRKSAGEIDHDL